MVRNILAVVGGILIGSVVNMSIVMIGYSFVPLPEGGLDVTLEARHVIFPFLAHAAGVFVGALVASLIAVSHQFKIAMGIAAFFLLGGITAVFWIAAPLWFEAVDMILA